MKLPNLDITEILRNADPIWVSTFSAAITAGATISLVVVTLIYIRFLASSEKKRTLREVADKVCGPALASLRQLENPARHFDYLVTFSNPPLGWIWEDIKSKQPYLSVRIPRGLYKDFEGFAALYKHYEGIRFQSLRFISSVISGKLGGRRMAVVFFGEHDTWIDRVAAEYLVCAGRTIQDYKDEIKRWRTLPGEVYSQVEKDGLIDTSKTLQQFDELLSAAREDIFQKEEGKHFIVYHKAVISSSRELTSKLERFLKVS